jgi:hypothetical protein
LNGASQVLILHVFHAEGASEGTAVVVVVVV